MRDSVFFPLAALLAGACIYIALDPYAERLPAGPVSGGGRNAEDITISGPELNRFVTGPDMSLSLNVRAGPSDESVLRIDRQAGGVYDDPRRGPHLVIAEDIEYAMESRPVEVTIEARNAGDFPASQFEANYLATAEGESGWVRFDLSGEFRPYTFSYVTPPRGGDMGYDYLGIRPVAPDKHREMEVRSVRVRAMGPKGEAPPPKPRDLMP